MHRNFGSIVTRSAPNPSAASRRVAATSPGRSGARPYFTLMTSPSGNRQSNFGVVALMAFAMNRHSTRRGRIERLRIARRAGQVQGGDHPGRRFHEHFGAGNQRFTRFPRSAGVIDFQIRPQLFTRKVNQGQAQNKGQG